MNRLCNAVLTTNTHYVLFMDSSWLKLAIYKCVNLHLSHNWIWIIILVYLIAVGYLINSATFLVVQFSEIAPSSFKKASDWTNVTQPNLFHFPLQSYQVPQDQWSQWSLDIYFLLIISSNIGKSRSMRKVRRKKLLSKWMEKMYTPVIHKVQTILMERHRLHQFQ